MFDSLEKFWNSCFLPQKGCFSAPALLSSWEAFNPVPSHLLDFLLLGPSSLLITPPLRTYQVALVVSDSLGPHGLQHARLPCPSPTPRAYSNSRPSSWWCQPTISSSVIPSSSCLQSFPASGSFPITLFFASGGKSIGVSASASVLPVNIQDWFPLGVTKLLLWVKQILL